ncbi:hypothetical protein Q428_07075 [Fervidicella metallireducens AeB]|uniref:Neutral metalloproteinase n=1 Tax=Fervidicella metallireducens AeB TaxID=1403537 RepID=A0A017RXG9_9CLOT|nr:M4 family metallopeptidase [Fervidicella metallireducens]EYE88615.1 hypothetical protein Q428_07075 [Fervidicella metallireducens AeB]
MKRFLSVFLTFLVTAFIVCIPVTSSAAKSNHNFLVKNMGKYSKDIKGIAKFFKDYKKEFNVEDAEKELVFKNSKNDNLGYTHVKLQQVVDGIPVYGKEYIIHYNNKDEVYAVNGNFDVKAKQFKRNKEFIKEKDAVAIAIAQVNFDSESLNTDLSDNLVPKLFLYELNEEYIPVYLIRINFLSPVPGDWFIFINALNGEVVEKYNKIRTVSVTGSGIGVLGDTKTLNLDKVTVKIRNKTETQYQTNDLTRSAVITTYTANNATRLPGSIVYSLSQIINDPAAVDAHYYAGVVYDYYKTKFGRNGIDNGNMTIKSTVHYSRNYVNAFWNGSQMVYGDGDGVNSLALSGGLDIIAHEMTHGVDEYEADLIYKDQSGALNESFSDCFGTFIEYFAQKNKFDWEMGEDVWTPKIANDALRSLQDPTKYGDPAHMNDYNYTTSDNGGVHTNCGIPNKACYLIATSSGMTIEKTEQIYYRALVNYLTQSSDFKAAKEALIQSAVDLYGVNSVEANAVKAAFEAVGIY